MRVRDQSVDVRIATCPTQFGEAVVMRLLRQDGGMVSLDKLRHAVSHAEAVPGRLSGAATGMITGHWARPVAEKLPRCTPHCSEINTVDQKIITVEDPVEYRLARHQSGRKLMGKYRFDFFQWYYAPHCGKTGRDSGR